MRNAFKQKSFGFTSRSGLRNADKQSRSRFASEDLRAYPANLMWMSAFPSNARMAERAARGRYVQILLDRMQVPIIPTAGLRNELIDHSRAYPLANFGGPLLHSLRQGDRSCRFYPNEYEQAHLQRKTSDLQDSLLIADIESRMNSTRIAMIQSRLGNQRLGILVKNLSNVNQSFCSNVVLQQKGSESTSYLARTGSMMGRSSPSDLLSIHALDNESKGVRPNREIVQRKTRNLTLPKESLEPKSEPSFKEIVDMVVSYNSLKNGNKPIEYISDHKNRLNEIVASIKKWKGNCCYQVFLKLCCCCLSNSRFYYLTDLEHEAIVELNELEKQFRIIKRIKQKFDIDIDQELARNAFLMEYKIKLPILRKAEMKNEAIDIVYWDDQSFCSAVKSSRYKNKSQKMKNEEEQMISDGKLVNLLEPRDWVTEELEDLETALNYFGQLLGGNRDASSGEQSLKIIGRFVQNYRPNDELHFEKTVDYGETLKANKAINLFDRLYVSNSDLGSFDSNFRLMSVPLRRKEFIGTIIHECSHGLIEDLRVNYLDEGLMKNLLYVFAYETGFWKDKIHSNIEVTSLSHNGREFDLIKEKCKNASHSIEPPISHYGTINASEDLAESMRYFLMGKAERDSLKSNCPIRFNFIKKYILKFLNIILDAPSSPNYRSLPTEVQLTTERQMEAPNMHLKNPTEEAKIPMANEKHPIDLWIDEDKFRQSMDDEISLSKIEEEKSEMSSIPDEKPSEEPG